MSEIEELKAQIAELRAEVADLRRNGWHEPRLGPRPETPEEAAAKSKRLADALTKAVEEAVNADTPPVDRTKLCTTNGKPVAEVRASQTAEIGQHDGYIVLCEDERAKGFVRPYRDAYKHIGRLVEVMTTPDPFEKGLKIPEQRREGGCGTVTTMGRALSETYARDPTFYGATFCCGCNKHLPVAEFVWSKDGQVVGS